VNGLRISLDEADFRQLVAGHVVKKEAWDTPGAGIRRMIPVQIALKDIGFTAMGKAIRIAIGGPKFPPLGPIDLSDKGTDDVVDS